MLAKSGSEQPNIDIQYIIVVVRDYNMWLLDGLHRCRTGTSFSFASSRIYTVMIHHLSPTSAAIAAVLFSLFVWQHLKRTTELLSPTEKQARQRSNELLQDVSLQCTNTDLSDDTFSVDSEGPRCWICLDDGDEERPLRRDCACKGAAGYAHLACIVMYAERKSQQWNGIYIPYLSEP